MLIPRWVSAIGILECLFGAWGLFSASTVVGEAGAHSMVSLAVVALMGLLAVASLSAGALLAKRDSRGLGPSVWVLALQSVRLVMPGFVWLVALGWNVLLVLHSGGEPLPDGQEWLVMLGHTDRPGYFALNLLAFTPLVALALWWRAAIVALRNGKDHEAAP